MTSLENNVSDPLLGLGIQRFGAIRSPDVVIAGTVVGSVRVVVVPQGGEMELLGGSNCKASGRTDFVQLCAELYARVLAELG